MARIKVAVLGGGCGAMAAAFELTATEALRNRYEVHVYQQGHRLGGKGASGRSGPENRIEEHGLHMWMGFYENAFRLMRDCFQEWDKPAGMSHVFPDALFEPQPRITIQQPVAEKDRVRWESWSFDTIAMPGVPGDINPPTPIDLLHALTEWVFHRHAELGSAAHPRHHQMLGAILDHVRSLFSRHGAATPSDHAGLVARIHELTSDFANVVRNLEDDALKVLIATELGLAVLRGYVVDILPHGESGFDRINPLEFREWLRSHGAGERVLGSGFVKALYDLGFAYVNGESTRPGAAQVAAGVALRVLLLMAFGCKGATLWKMRAGMGDTIFAPLYEVLVKRGVQFHFFHRVEHLGLGAGSADRTIESIQLTRQVKLAGPEYAPLFTVGEFRCWPSEPFWGQIHDGDAIRRELDEKGLSIESYWCNLARGGPAELRRGVDFDAVVLGISIGALPFIANELGDREPRWQAMIENVLTVPTQALQLWLTPTLEQTGWRAGSTVSVGYTEPLDSWGEMSHLRATETWPAPGPGSIQYFCGALPDDRPLPPRSDEGYPARAHAKAQDVAAQWLTQWAGHLWPDGADREGKGFDWQWLYDPGSTMRGPNRIESQFIRVNVDPTERYVLSVPDSPRYRLDAGDTGFENLVIAGDWVRTRLNSGCVEAAVEAGMNAARALIGRPGTIAGPPRSARS